MLFCYISLFDTCSKLLLSQPNPEFLWKPWVSKLCRTLRGFSLFSTSHSGPDYILDPVPADNNLPVHRWAERENGWRGLAWWALRHSDFAWWLHFSCRCRVLTQLKMTLGGGREPNPERSFDLVLCLRSWETPQREILAAVRENRLKISPTEMSRHQKLLRLAVFRGCFYDLEASEDSVTQSEVCVRLIGCTYGRTMCELLCVLFTLRCLGLLG